MSQLNIEVGRTDKVPQSRTVIYNAAIYNPTLADKTSSKFPNSPTPDLHKENTTNHDTNIPDSSNSMQHDSELSQKRNHGDAHYIFSCCTLYASASEKVHVANKMWDLGEDLTKEEFAFTNGDEKCLHDEPFYY